MAKAVKTKQRTPEKGRPPAEPGRQPRQERGERRVEEILDAAAEVIAEVGVDAATTNAIAERAGSSVGSLYHFFPNKEAIIRALASRYDGELRAVNQAAIPEAAAKLPVPEMVEGIVTPLAHFIERNPAYMPVFHATRDPRNPGCMTEDLTETIVGLVEHLMAARTPSVPADLRRLRAGVAVELVHRMLNYAWTAPPAQREKIVRELKRLLALYAGMIASGEDPLAGTTGTRA
jgi:AcrR family transcriptional regulator